MTTTPKPQRFQVVLAFVLVYIFWGSTYLGIGVGVEHIPAALMAGIRFAVAGSLMLAYCHFAGRGIRMDRRQTLHMLVIGVLLLSISNVILCWAENYVATGLAALIVSCTPIWFLLIEMAIGRKEERPGASGVLGVLLGIAGVIVLLWPKIRGITTLHWREVVPAMILPLASFCWAFGSVLSRRWQSKLDPFSASGWQMLFAGLVNIAFGFSVGDQRHAQWGDWRGWAAILYLVVFGSWVGYSAYVFLLRHVPTAKVATYAYVNPVVALLLGVYLGPYFNRPEQITGYVVAGTIMVVPAVALVTGVKLKKTASAPEEEPGLPEVEAGAD